MWSILLVLKLFGKLCIEIILNENLFLVINNRISF